MLRQWEPDWDSGSFDKKILLLVQRNQILLARTYFHCEDTPGRMSIRNSTVREVVHVSANELNHNQQHRFTRLYAEFIHRSTLHAGARVLLSLLREEVWNALTASTTSLVSCHTSWEISLRIDCTASAHIWCQEMSSAGPSWPRTKFDASHPIKLTLQSLFALRRKLPTSIQFLS